jgi:PAS domain S-box-containing protein
MSDDETRRLGALLALKILDTPPEPAFDDIVQLARVFCETPVALISLVAADRQWFKARVGFAADETSIGQSVCVHALPADDLLIIPDLALDARTRDNILVTGHPHIRFYAGAPLKNSDGVAVGTLCVIDDKPRAHGLTPQQADVLRALCRQTMAIMIMRRAAQSRDEALVRLREAGLATLDRALVNEATIDRLRATEARIRAAQEAGRVGAFEVDIATGRCVVTPEFCRLFGMPVTEELPTTAIEAAVLPEDRHIASNAASLADGTAAHDSEYRIRRLDDGTLRWISRRGAFDWDAIGKPVRWLGVVQDVTERKLVETRRIALVSLGDTLRDVETTHDVVEAASRILGQTLSASRAGYGVVDRAAGTLTIARDWASSQGQRIAGSYSIATFAKTFENLKDGAPLVVANVPAASWLGTDAAGYEAVNTMALIVIPLIRRRELVGTLFVHSATPRTWTAGEIAFADSVADRTYAAIAKVSAEDHQRLLNQELSHRLKNTLAMVQAIATQTLRGANDKVAVRAFEERVIALSNAHDMLLQENWTAASIRSVAEGVLKVQGCADRVVVAGPDLKVGPKATLSVAMLLHELATNAIKYGSLSVDDGRVVLSWHADLDDAKPILTMIWAETDGPPTRTPTRRGFGSRLISMGIAGAGHADMNYAETGLVARFRAPMSAIVEY